MGHVATAIPASFLCRSSISVAPHLESSAIIFVRAKPAEPYTGFFKTPCCCYTLIHSGALDFSVRGLR
jgi:hypothetical protein